MFIVENTLFFGRARLLSSEKTSSHSRKKGYPNIAMFQVQRLRSLQVPVNTLAPRHPMNGCDVDRSLGIMDFYSCFEGIA